jgi:hypothetical protein
MPVCTSLKTDFQNSKIASRLSVPKIIAARRTVDLVFTKAVLLTLDQVPSSDYSKRVVPLTPELEAWGRYGWFVGNPM